MPVPGGCLLCGVDAVTLPAARVAVLGGRRIAQQEVWRPFSASPSSLGGQGPDRLTGHVCPRCADALDWVGRTGPTAMKRALTEHLRATGRDEDADRLRMGEVEGLVGWGTLAYAARRRGAPAPAANGEPWAHILVRPDWSAG